MATADRGLVDVERFDADPDRPILHGLLEDVDIDLLGGLSPRDKIPHVLRIVDASRGSARAAASMIEVGQTISTWPQAAGEVILGASAIAEAVRRIGLGEPLGSGRVRFDVADALDDLREPTSPDPPPPDRDDRDARDSAIPAGDVAELVAQAAALAPSGGNSQPWRIENGSDRVLISLEPAYSSTMDVGFRASAVALGAAVFNARVAAAAHQVLGSVHLTEGAAHAPLTAVVHLGSDRDPELADLYQPMLARQTNRHRGIPRPLPADTAEALSSAAHGQGCRVALLTDLDQISAAAELFGEADRIRYLTGHLHADMVSELRWPSDTPDGAGIDVLSLELDAADLATLDILRRPDVMARLAQWNGGEALGAATRAAVSSCSALAVVIATGGTLTDYARGGSAAEAVWIAAQSSGLAVHPVSPVFLYANAASDFDELAPVFAPKLSRLCDDFRMLTAIAPNEVPILVLKLSNAAVASARSLRSADRRGRGVT